ncbi:uncharacterized protein LOC133178219 [Saccostrea echinata]|uniref:uncharacterized protein LOC133178219 n=1 Tax=Saccostrea echinata TaxID=191078 RepID=UPI002A8064E7|nr:uncharacterized protein LOC133178219 [Saccostrea echinata]
MKNRQLDILRKHLSEIHEKISKIKEAINSVDTALDSTHISNLLKVPSTVDEYRQLPKKIIVSLPNFSPKKLLADQLCSLTPMSLKSDERGYCMNKTQKSAIAGSFQVKHLLDKPETVITLNTGYEYLINVACLGDGEIWTSGEEPTMKLFNINQGSLLKSITIKTGNIPDDIAMGNCGEVIYTNHNDRSVKMVKNETTKEMIRLQHWRPRSVCSTSCGDIMVVMDTDDWKQSKVVRYSGSKEKGTIQFDDKGNPHYSSGFCYRCITENRNLDICVTDSKSRAVVVVSKSGKLRFRYTGHTRAPKIIPFNHHRQSG